MKTLDDAALATVSGGQNQPVGGKKDQGKQTEMFQAAMKSLADAQEKRKQAEDPMQMLGMIKQIADMRKKPSGTKTA
jgi:hypothetical protein